MILSPLEGSMRLIIHILDKVARNFTTSKKDRYWYRLFYSDLGNPVVCGLTWWVVLCSTVAWVFITIGILGRGCLAQLVERTLRMREVRCSTRLSSNCFCCVIVSPFKYISLDNIFWLSMCKFIWDWKNQKKKLNSKKPYQHFWIFMFCVVTVWFG